MKHESPKELYLRELRAWNKIHRLTGSKDLDALYSESLKALRSHPSLQNIIDIGAGSGILGVPALLEIAGSKVALLEPDSKSVAFLIHFKSCLKREFPEFAESLAILATNVQNVSRETVDHFFQGAPFVLVSRAFSGAEGLKDAVAKSSLKNVDLFSFALSQSQKFVLEKI